MATPVVRQRRPASLPLRKKLFFMLVMVVVTLGLLEVGLRLTWNRPPQVQTMSLRATGLIVPDPEIGWRNQPNQHRTHRFPLGVEDVTISTNARGFRDTDHPPEPTPGRPRVVVLGDSFTFGYGVSNGQIFTDHLRELLPRAEVINLGITATHTAQQHKLLEREGLSYRPQLVVLAFCQNDITWQVIPRAEESVPRPEDGGGWKSFLCDHLYLCDFVRTQARTNKNLSRAFATVGLATPPGGYAQLSDYVRPALKQYPEELQEMWRATLAEIAAMRKTCEGAGARLVLAPIPARESVEPAALARAVQAIEFEPDDFDLDKPYLALDAFCRREGIAFLNVVPDFRDGGAEYYLPHGEMHFNARGHRRFAELLAPQLQGLLGPGRSAGAGK